MATLVWSAGRNEEPEYLLEFLRTRETTTLTNKQLGLRLLHRPQPELLFVGCPPGLSIAVCVIRESRGLPSAFPPEQDRSLQDILKSLGFPHFLWELIVQATVVTGRKRLRAINGQGCGLLPKHFRPPCCGGKDPRQTHGTWGPWEQPPYRSQLGP